MICDGCKLSADTGNMSLHCGHRGQVTDCMCQHRPGRLAQQGMLILKLAGNLGRGTVEDDE